MAQFKKILNISEEVVYAQLKEIAIEYGYEIHIKQRPAEILPIEGSGISNTLFRYAIQSHFDFLILNQDRFPLFAVEFDGPTHLNKIQKERDSKKDELCKRFELPLLRITTSHLMKKYNKASILKWIISAWELQNSFYDAQEKGLIPDEEQFDPVMLWHQGKTFEEKHPHWIALKARFDIERLYRQGRIPIQGTCQAIFLESDGTYRGVEWIDLAPGKVLSVKASMKKQIFPLGLRDLFSQLLTVSLHEKLTRCLETGDGVVNAQSVTSYISEMRKNYTFYGSHSNGSTSVNISSIF